jgi:competence protein ComEC
MGGLMLIVGIAITTIIASAAVAPFGLYHFHQSQQFAILGNLLALPVVNIVVMPMALLTLLALPFGLEAGPLSVMALGINAVLACAVWVASLPGATLRVPTLPDSALVFMVLGGLWLLLWRTRWRLLGVAPIGLGLAMVPTLIRPDILIGRDGRALMVRDGAAKLQALPFRGKGFEVSRWLQADGDGRAARDAINRSLFLCDATGCSARVPKVAVTVSWHPAGLRDDCKRARILILRYNRKESCAGPELIIDRAALIKHGSHAIFVGTTGLRLDTVSQTRGQRPWTRTQHLKVRRAVTGHGVKSRWKRTATPRPRHPRP